MAFLFCLDEMVLLFKCDGGCHPGFQGCHPQTEERSGGSLWVKGLHPCTLHAIPSTISCAVKSAAGPPRLRVAPMVLLSSHT